MPLLTRRSLLVSAAAVALPMGAAAAQRASLKDPMRLTVDDAFMDSGLASKLQKGFGRDTGVAVQLIREPVTRALEALDRGERDAALTNAPELELKLVSLGFAHHRTHVADGEFVLVGPMSLRKPLAAGNDIVLALHRLAEVQTTFLGNRGGNGEHLGELALWRAAQLQPAAPWYAEAAADLPVWQQARAKQACAIVERGAFLAGRGADKHFGILVDGDARQVEPVHMLFSFRAHHPSSKLFIDWIAGRQGRRAVPSVPGYKLA